MHTVARDRDVIVFEGFVTREHKTKSDYLYLEFEVPPGVRSIEVDYSYEPREGCTIDIGIFSPGPLEFLKAGKNFRGWSGSNKRSFVVSEGYSTPSYLEGPITPGMWNIVLGLYEIPKEGCRYKVRVKLGRCAKIPGKGKAHMPRKAATKKLKRGWIAADLHLHTHHSDGDATVEEVAERASEAGLDLIAITDHNTTSHLDEIRELESLGAEISIMPGEEVTTYYGHFNVYNLDSWVDFRITSDRQLLEVLEYIFRKHSIASVNHPKPFGPPWELGHIEKFGVMEVWQGIWEFNNYISLRAWDEVLLGGHRMIGIGGSDTHRVRSEGSIIHEVGVPTTWIYSEGLDAASIVDAITRGRICISESPNGPRIDLAGRSAGLPGYVTMGGHAEGGELKVAIKTVGAKGNHVRLIVDGAVHSISPIDKNVFQKVERISLKSANYARADIVKSGPLDEPYDEDLVLAALSNPIFLTRENAEPET